MALVFIGVSLAPNIEQKALPRPCATTKVSGLPSNSRRLLDLLLAGALGGLTGGLAGFPGLAVTIWCGLRGWPKETQRGIFQPFILVMQLEALALLQAGGTTAQFNTMVSVLLAASGAALLSGVL